MNGARQNKPRNMPRGKKQEPEKAVVSADTGKYEIATATVYFCRLLEEIQKQNELLAQLLDVVIPKYVSDIKDNINANSDAQTQALKPILETIATNTRKRGL